MNESVYTDAMLVGAITHEEVSIELEDGQDFIFCIHFYTKLEGQFVVIATWTERDGELAYQLEGKSWKEIEEILETFLGRLPPYKKKVLILDKPYEAEEGKKIIKKWVENSE